jgi:hypothetical protein
MARSRKFLTAGALGVGALALIGAGAGATFHTSTTATQTITAGTPQLTVYSSSVPACASADSNCRSITLPTFGPVGSKFETNHIIITLKNTGNIAVDTAAFQMSETDNGSNPSAALLAQTNVCVQSTDYSGGPWTEINGPLSAGVALKPSVVENDVHLLPGDTMTFSVDFYAGQDSSQCNPVHSDGSDTLARWDSYLGGPYQTPASLTDAAVGGSITPTLTFSFTA